MRILKFKKSQLKKLIREALMNEQNPDMMLNHVNGDYGNFIFELLPNNNLKMTITDAGREEILDIVERHPEYNDYTIMHELMDGPKGGLWGNGWADLTGNVGLTDAFAIGYDYQIDETTGEPIDAVGVWAYMDYQVSSMVEKIMEDGFIIFQWGK